MRQRNQLEGECHRLYDEGKLGEAIRAGEAALKVDRELLPQYDAASANLMRYLGGIHLERRDYATARNAWDGVVEIEGRLYGPQNPGVTQAKWMRAEVDRWQSLPEADQEALAQAHRQFEHDLRIVSNQQKYEDALAIAEQVWLTRRRLLEADDPDVTAARMAMADFYARLNDPDSSEPELRGAMASYARTLGKSSIQYLQCLRMLADALRSRTLDSMNVADYDAARAQCLKQIDAEQELGSMSTGLQEARERLQEIDRRRVSAGRWWKPIFVRPTRRSRERERCGPRGGSRRLWVKFTTHSGSWKRPVGKTTHSTGTPCDSRPI